MAYTNQFPSSHKISALMGFRGWTHARNNERTNHISGTADRLRRCQLTSLVSVINFWWSSDDCWLHPPSRSVFTLAYRPRPSKRNGLIKLPYYANAIRNI